jgi:hypothetical protein
VGFRRYNFADEVSNVVFVWNILNYYFSNLTLIAMRRAFIGRKMKPLGR